MQNSQSLIKENEVTMKRRMCTLSELVKKIGEKGGASAYSRVAAKALEDYSQKLKVTEPNDFFDKLEKYANVLIEENPSMASVINAMEYVLNPLREFVKSGKTLQECKALVSERVASFIRKSKEAAEKIAQFGSNMIENGDIILTHSFSSIVLKILETAGSLGKHIKVIITESRPQFEGYELATELVERNIPVTIIADAAVCTIMRRVSKVIVGADSILADGSIINKVGTFSIALTAQLNNVPLLVAAESFKLNPFSVRGGSPKLRVGKPEDLIDFVKFGLVKFRERGLLEVWNPIFEVVPSRYITALITDLGILPVHSAITEFMKILHST